MKSSQSKRIQICLFTVLFALSYSSVFYAQTYADLEARNQQLLEDSKKNKSWGKNFGRGDLAIGYAHMPFRFGPTSVKSTLDGLPELNQNLPEVDLQSGFNLQVNLNLNGRSYLGIHFSFILSSKQESRKRDFAGFALIAYGYRFPIQKDNENHFFSLEGGFGYSNWERPFTNVERFRMNLNRANLILAPSVSYDINIHKQKIFLFLKYRFIYDLVNIGSESGLGYQNKDSSGGVNTVRLDNNNIVSDDNATLNLGNLSEFSIGFRFFMK